MQRKTAQNPLIKLDHYSRTTNLILSPEDEKHSVCSFYLMLIVVWGDAIDCSVQVPKGDLRNLAT